MAKPLIRKFVAKAAPMSEDAPAVGPDNVEAPPAAAAAPDAEAAPEDDALPPPPAPDKSAPPTPPAKNMRAKGGKAGRTG